MTIGRYLSQRVNFFLMLLKSNKILLMISPRKKCEHICMYVCILYTVYKYMFVFYFYFFSLLFL